VVGSALAGLALIGFLTAMYTRSPAAPVRRVKAETPQQALTYLCSQFRSGETAFAAGGAKAEATFEQRMTTITSA
jgi:hypothetical protein